MKHLNLPLEQILNLNFHWRKVMEIEEKLGRVTCRLCGKQFGLITPQHLKRFHNVTIEQYKMKYPDQQLWGKAFTNSVKYAGTDLFKNSPVEIDKIPKVGEIRIPKDLEDFQKKEDVVVEKMKNMPMGKSGIYDVLRKYFGYVETNYFIEKIDLTGHLAYRVVTDFYVPLGKIIIEFPNSYWHNYEPSSEVLKRDIIPNEGYKVIRILSKNPTTSGVEDELLKHEKAGII
jgi:hypothetical protein